MPCTNENVLLAGSYRYDLVFHRLPESARFLPRKPALQRQPGLHVREQIIYIMTLILGSEKAPNGRQDLQSGERGRPGRERVIVNHQYVFWEVDGLHARHSLFQL
jgi:hypothetical protein